MAAIRRAGGEAVPCRADLTKQDDVLKLKYFSTSTFGESLDVLVNNSGGLIARKKLEEQDERFYNAVMDVNFKSLFLVTRTFVKLMRPGAAIPSAPSPSRLPFSGSALDHTPAGRRVANVDFTCR